MMNKIVLVWASNNPDKFWYKILKNLLEKNFEVFPVNPKWWEILWQKVYKNISEINNGFDIINFVTQPEITLNILKSHLDFLQNKTIWCQPWSIDEKWEEFIKKYFKDSIINSCIMIEKI